MGDDFKKFKKGRCTAMKTKLPAFDITLADVILEFDLTEKELQDLGLKTMRREIANTTIGGQTYYRRGTIERLYGKK